VAYCSTLNPVGAFGHASAVLATIAAMLRAAAVACGGGSSAGLILSEFTGYSWR
jgi:hypothetical protein